MSGDIIRWMLDWMLANETSITEEMALRAEMAAREEWGGQEVGYIARKPQSARRAVMDAALAEIDAGATPAEVAKRHEIDPATLARELRRRRVGPGDAVIRLGHQGGRFGGSRR